MSIESTCPDCGHLWVRHHPQAGCTDGVCECETPRPGTVAPPRDQPPVSEGTP